MGEELHRAKSTHTTREIGTAGTHAVWCVLHRKAGPSSQKASGRLQITRGRKELHVGGASLGPQIAVSIEIAPGMPAEVSWRSLGWQQGLVRSLREGH